MAPAVFVSGRLQPLLMPLPCTLPVVAAPVEVISPEVLTLSDGTLFQLAIGKAPATSVALSVYGPGRAAGVPGPCPLKLMLMTCAGDVTAKTRVTADASQIAAANRR